MAGEKYIFNQQTQSYEIDRRSVRAAFYKTGGILLGGLALFLLYFFVFTRTLGLDTPKTLLLERQNRILTEQLALLDGRIDADDQQLQELALRDNLVYRPVFGMEEVPAARREAGLGGEDRYAAFLGLAHQDLMAASAARVDGLMRKAYVQSVSFDEVKVYSSRAGDMASCIPSIYPVNPKNVQITSPFGARFHPIRQTIVFHEGIDLASSTTASATRPATPT